MLDGLSEIFAGLEILPQDAPSAPTALRADGCFESADAALNFMLAGNATVTLVSTRTGTRFTYKVRKSDDGAVHFVGLLNGPDNVHSYAYMGLVRHSVNGPAFRAGGAKARIAADAPSARAFAWAFGQLVAGRMPDTLEVWHEGSCGRCGRKLTVPASIASGFGPECEGKM